MNALLFRNAQRIKENDSYIRHLNICPLCFSHLYETKMRKPMRHILYLGLKLYLTLQKRRLHNMWVVQSAYSDENGESLRTVHWLRIRCHFQDGILLHSVHGWGRDWVILYYIPGILFSQFLKSWLCFITLAHVYNMEQEQQKGKQW